MRINCALYAWLALVPALLFLTPPQARSASAAEDTLYAAPKILALRIELPPPQLEALRRDAKTYVKGTLRDGSRAYADVGIRLKGAMSALLLDKKPSLVLKFDEFETSQLFYGRDKITLNNSLDDPTYLCEALGGEIFRAAGVPAFKVTFARVELNGRDLGLYVVAQTSNRDFLGDYFTKTKGNYYEGDNLEVTEKLRLDSGSGPKDHADLKKLAEAAREPNAAERLRKLEAVLDLDRFVSFVACEVFTSHRKGYSLGRNNYRVYHDPESDRLVFMPETLDNLFGNAKEPVMPECLGLVARTWLETPEGQRRYRERMAQLLATAFKPAALQKRMDDLAAIIQPALPKDSADLKAFNSGMARLRDNIAQRAKFLEEELKKPQK